MIRTSRLDLNRPDVARVVATRMASGMTSFTARGVSIGGETYSEVAGMVLANGSVFRLRGRLAPESVMTPVIGALPAELTSALRSLSSQDRAA